MEEKDLHIEEKANREYRISFILRDEDASFVRGVVEKIGGVITIESPLVKVRLSYPIKKQLFGFSGSYIISSTDEKLIDKVLSALKLDEKVLRILGTRKPKYIDEEKRTVPDAATRARARRRPAREGGKNFRTELSNEALEKKIEEILQ